MIKDTLSNEKQLNGINLFLWLLVPAIGYVNAVESVQATAVFFAGASILACLLIILKINDRILRNILMVAFILRLILVLLQAYTGIELPGSGDDTVRFERYAWENVQAWFYGVEGGKSTGAYYYSAWIGLLYSITGRFPLIPQLANVYFSLITIYLVYRTTFFITGFCRAARFGALLVAIIPSLNIFAAILLRESMIILFVFLSFYYMILWMKSGGLIYIIGAFISLTLAGAMHGVMFLLIWVYVLLIVFFSPMEKRIKLTLTQLLPALFILLLASMLLGSVITHSIPGNLADIITPDYIRRVVENKAISRTTYLPGVVPYSYFDLFWQTPLRVIFLLFAPFPWALENWRDIFGFFDATFYAILIYYGLIGARCLFSNNKQAVITAFLIVISMAVMFAWGTTNYGTTWRHRQKLAPFVVVLASAGMAGSPRWKKLFDDKSISEEI